MELSKFGKYINKSIQVGPRATFIIIFTRFYSKFFDKRCRKKALANKAHYFWNSIFKRHRAKKYEQFQSFWHDLLARFTLDEHSFFLESYEPVYIQQADEYCEKFFSVLGSRKKQYTEIPWHLDIRLLENATEAESLFDSSCYYKDIKIDPGNNQFSKDIKVPWELSRLHHLFILGYAYSQLGNEKYEQTFIDHFESWQKNNSFLLGTNWVCPMEVGIRAINIVWALYYFKNSTTIPLQFFQRVTESLYDHLFYLENNWEIYDTRTSNHYLSDLIGYFYLCYYFFDLPHIKKRAEWCFQEIVQECTKQILVDGSDYEGSTSYHILVTELFYHFYLLAPKMEFVIPQEFIDKLRGMFTFISRCTTHGMLLRIGDNDSGKIIPCGLNHNIITMMSEKNDTPVHHFKQFGLSLAKIETVSYSLRHHVYNKRQPSGHFHNDVASITLTSKGVDIFIDPGSYVYTPSVQWRNYFRSVQNHNTFYIHDNEPVEFDDFLFSLQLPEQDFSDEWYTDVQCLHLKTSHTLYKKRFGLTAYRTLEYKPSGSKIIIVDYWKTIHKKDPDVLSWWNFTLNPSIAIEKNAANFTFIYRDLIIATFTSSINFDLIDGFSSPAYGVKVPTKQLRAMVNIVADDPIITEIELF